MKWAKAAYLMVKGSIGEDLSSKEEFSAALQLAGFNPTSRSLRSHWADTTRQITFSQVLKARHIPVLPALLLALPQFCNITEIEPVPTEDSLVAAFHKLDDKK